MTYADDEYVRGNVDDEVNDKGEKVEPENCVLYSVLTSQFFLKMIRWNEHTGVELLLTNKIFLLPTLS